MKKRPFRPRSLQKLSRVVPNVTTAVFEKQGFAQAAIISDWEYIVGPDTAKVSLPEKVNFQGNKREGGVLFVRASGPTALEIQYKSPFIIQQVNSYFGYQAVARIAISQRPLPFKKAPIFKKESKLSQSDESEISQMTQDLDDDLLAQSLQNLGKQLYKKKS